MDMAGSLTMRQVFYAPGQFFAGRERRCQAVGKMLNCKEICSGRWKEDDKHGLQALDCAVRAAELTA
jgi:hypothetical protein